jgi:hypothetical protein
LINGDYARLCQHLAWYTGSYKPNATRLSGPALPNGKAYYE